MFSFNAFALGYFKPLILLFQRADTVVEVFERCDEDNSIKTAELDRRAGPTAPCSKLLVRAVPCTSTEEYPQRPIHKQSLTNFLSEYVVRYASHWLDAHTTCTLLVVEGFADGDA